MPFTISVVELCIKKQHTKWDFFNFAHEYFCVNLNSKTDSLYLRIKRAKLSLENDFNLLVLQPINSGRIYIQRLYCVHLLIGVYGPIPMKIQFSMYNDILMAVKAAYYGIIFLLTAAWMDPEFNDNLRQHRKKFFKKTFIIRRTYYNTLFHLA